jgi:hypothetical protein
LGGGRLSLGIGEGSGELASLLLSALCVAESVAGGVLGQDAAGDLIGETREPVRLRAGHMCTVLRSIQQLVRLG